jgi:hypothetical protein
MYAFVCDQKNYVLYVRYICIRTCNDGRYCIYIYRYNSSNPLLVRSHGQATESDGAPPPIKRVPEGLTTAGYVRYTISQLFNGFGVKNSDVHVVNSYSEDIPQEVEGAADAGGVTFQVDTKASKLFINHAICHFIDVRIDTPQISPQPGTLLKTSLSRIELDCTLLPRQGLDVLHKNTARRLRQSFGRELAAQASFKGIHTSFSWASFIWINHKWNEYF